MRRVGKDIKNFNRFIIYECFYLRFANEHEYFRAFISKTFEENGLKIFRPFCM